MLVGRSQSWGVGARSATGLCALKQGQVTVETSYLRTPGMLGGGPVSLPVVVVVGCRALR